MKKPAIGRLPLAQLFIILAVLLTSLVLSWVLLSRQSMNNARNLIGINMLHVANQIMQNDKTLYTLRLESDAQSIAKARAFAYMIRQDPSLVHDEQKLLEIRRLLDVDELHVSDSKGILTGSTIRSYIGYDYASDPQSRPFLLAIYYKDFKLAQQPMPKGAEKKEMFQYTGVARLDEPGIVQIGYKPERLYRALAAADIRKVAHGFSIRKTGTITVTDLDGKILSSTDGRFVGKEITAPGFSGTSFRGPEGSFIETIGNRSSFYVYRIYDDHMIIGSLGTDELYERRNQAMLVQGVSSAVLFLLMTIFLTRKQNAVTRKETG
jgi:methyl-accepting chemotaxis protein